MLNPLEANGVFFSAKNACLNTVLCVSKIINCLLTINRSVFYLFFLKKFKNIFSLTTESLLNITLNIFRFQCNLKTEYFFLLFVKPFVKNTVFIIVNKYLWIRCPLSFYFILQVTDDNTRFLIFLPFSQTMCSLRIASFICHFVAIYLWQKCQNVIYFEMS